MKKNVITNEIVISAQKGNEDSFNQIYTHYYKRIYFMAYEYFHNESLSEDIVQDVMLSIYKNLKNIQTPEAMHSWIMKAGYHRCIDEMRKKKIKFSYGDDDENFIETIPDNNPVDLTGIDEEEIKQAIVDSLESMSFQLKSVGLLRFYEDLSIDEISDILGIPNGTVKSRISKIKKNLQVDLSKKDITPSTYTVHVITPAAITAAYVFLSDKMNISESTKNATFAGIVGVSSGIAISGVTSKLIASLLAASVVIGGGIAISMNVSSVKTKPIVVGEFNMDQQSQEVAKLTDINYTKSATNKSITISVNTSNDNWDKILINGEDTNVINQNGDYKIDLIKDGKVVDSKTISITNIDKEAPVNTSYEKDANEVVTMHYHDNVGIDYTKTVFLVNGVESNDYHTDQANNTITFQGVLNNNYQIIVYDQSGNYLESDAHIKED